MAWSTPGYWTLTATMRQSRSTASVDLADVTRRDRHRVPLEEDPVGVGAELGLDHRLGAGSVPWAGVGLAGSRGRPGQSGGRPSAMKPSSWPAFMMGALHVTQLAGDVLGARGRRTAPRGAGVRPRRAGRPDLDRRPSGLPAGGEPPDPGRAFDPAAAAGQRGQVRAATASDRAPRDATAMSVRRGHVRKSVPTPTETGFLSGERAEKRANPATGSGIGWLDAPMGRHPRVAPSVAERQSRSASLILSGSVRSSASWPCSCATSLVEVLGAGRGGVGVAPRRSWASRHSESDTDVCDRPVVGQG
jgi:hypothetical protein